MGRSPLFLVISLVSACGSSAASPAIAPRSEPTPAPSVTEPPPTQGRIDRGVLLGVLDAGLGRFLQGVATEAVLDEGEFHGFRILSLYPDDQRFRDLDLGPGDLITSINGQSIERPEEALAVWESLRVVSALMITYERDGVERELRFEIAD